MRALEIVKDKESKEATPQLRASCVDHVANAVGFGSGKRQGRLEADDSSERAADADQHPRFVPQRK